jgi:hypothetical protein
MLANAEDVAFLRRATEELIDASTVQPTQRISTGLNTTGRALLTPGNNRAGATTYPAYWVRDPAWVTESGLIPAADVWGWLTLMTQTMQGHTARSLASGGLIPPYSVADHINMNGSPVFYPGTYASDDTQGPPFGKYPPHDDQYWVSFTAFAYAKLTGRWESFLEHTPTPMGEMPLWQVCHLTHNAFPVDSKTQLCVAPDSLSEHIVDWGYNDTINKTGKLLFPSLLRYESALKLAHLCEHNEMHDEALSYQHQVGVLRRALIETFYQEDARHEGWFVSATGIGNQPDVWGSAYAVYLGLLPPELEQAVARWLLRGYTERTMVLEGQVRHLPTTDGYWEAAQCAAGTYQNGGYWGYPAGWYLYALSRVDASAAAAMLTEFVRYQREHWGAGLQSCAWECINPELDHYQNPGYLTTIALPYVCLMSKGLI